MGFVGLRFLRLSAGLFRTPDAIENYFFGNLRLLHVLPVAFAGVGLFALGSALYGFLVTRQKPGTQNRPSFPHCRGRED